MAGAISADKLCKSWRLHGERFQMTRWNCVALGLVLVAFVATGCSRSDQPKAPVASLPAPPSVTPTVAPPVTTVAQTAAQPAPSAPPTTVAQTTPAAPPTTPTQLLPVSTTTTTVTTTTEPPVAAAPTQTVVASPIISAQPIAEPALKPEIITPEPSAEHVWIPGDWERTPDQWKWVAGHWEKAPFGNARWVGGYWKWEAGQYVWNPGHWGTADPGMGMVVAKPVDIPALPAVSAPVVATPPVGTQLVPAHWEWTAYGWSLVPAYYATVPAPQAVWVDGHWKQGLFGQWRWIAGHWQTK
jgi:hypothetical protein